MASPSSPKLGSRPDLDDMWRPNSAPKIIFLEHSPHAVLQPDATADRGNHDLVNALAGPISKTDFIECESWNQENLVEN